jgi:superfamily II RNA helicase
MVKVCSTVYPREKLPVLEESLETLKPFEPDDFQKWAMEAIITGNHVLVTAPTGTGKTFAGEFAITTLFARNMKTIYCCPIKALSAEKYYQFTHKYPHIRVGIVTGDTKLNTDADVIIMTTEILLNKLKSMEVDNSSSAASSSASRFEMDIATELGSVVFDEIHFINDASRGHVWEQSLLLLPASVQIVGLSATLDDPEGFARWIEHRHEGGVGGVGGKIVYLAQKTVRPVPLIHSTFLTYTQSLFKTIRDKTTQEMIRRVCNKPRVLMNENKQFSDATYQETERVLHLMHQAGHKVSRPHVLNKVTEYLVQEELLPALCYVFHRKQLEICAHELNTNLLEFDSKIPYTVDRECETLLRERLPNYAEYLALPAYQDVVALLRKGIGMHHAGMMPILREMTELLFSRGFIKVLFCTETMSVGINLPVKTTLFTDVKKFSGKSVQVLEPHTYTQAAGRAGRRGKDTVGHVIHLNNLFRSVVPSEIRKMMGGTPAVLQSKFKFSYDLALSGRLPCLYANSLLHRENEAQLNALKQEYEAESAAEAEPPVLTTTVPWETLEEYDELQRSRLGNQERKRLNHIRGTYSAANLDTDWRRFKEHQERQKARQKKRNEWEAMERRPRETMEALHHLLVSHGFLMNLPFDTMPPEPTYLGTIASHIREVPCLPMAEVYSMLKRLDADELIQIFSCFTSITEAEAEQQEDILDDVSVNVNQIIRRLQERIEYFQQQEQELFLEAGESTPMHLMLLSVIPAWIAASNEVEAKEVIESLKGMFLGEFVKALLKIVCISQELAVLAQTFNELTFLQELQKIPEKIMKFVVTNQSLYI